MTEENLEQTAVTEGAETTPGTETKKKTTRKKSSTGTKRATVADVMKRLDTIEKNMAENAALAAESDGGCLCGTETLRGGVRTYLPRTLRQAFRGGG